MQPPANYLARMRNASAKIMPVLAFTVPFIILYALYPASFELTWKGRTFYLFFLWLAALETILNWEDIQKTKVKLQMSRRTLTFAAAIFLPILYIFAAHYWGLNQAILRIAEQNNVSPNVIGFMPLSIEYMVFTALFALTIALYHGTHRLNNYSISTIFLGMIGLVYTMDNLYPWGRFTPFQIFVPATTVLAASILNILGFTTAINYTGNNPQLGAFTPRLTAQALDGRIATYYIAWPCSGVESLLIYSVTILLFLKNSTIRLTQKIIYFTLGAAVTYVINALRIATIYTIDINGGDVGLFHNYYGQLYSITWIMSYPLLIIAARILWARMRAGKTF